MWKNKSVFLLLLSFLCLPLFSEVKIPSPSHVMDQAGVLSESQETKIVSLLRDFNQKTKATMYILILDSLEGESIEGFSIRAIDSWGKKAPGDKDRDDGLLLTIALKDRKIRLEVGQGLEGAITDSRAGDLIRSTKNYLRNRDYSGAIANMIDGSAHYINGSSISGKAYKPAKKDKKVSVWLVLIVIIVIMLLSSGGRGGGFYISTGGGFSGGFRGSGGSFGSSGGGFSGGGASGSW